MNKSAFHILFLCLLLIAEIGLGQIAINNAVTATQMAESIMLPSNKVVPGSVVLNCPNGAYGTFSNGLSDGLEIDGGIILTTGSTAKFTTNNIQGDAGLDAGIKNYIDADLQTVQPLATFDVCVLEFDIQTSCNKINLEYIFGSEEYPEYVNQAFNDAFGFFVSGPGITGVENIGTIPGSSTLVSINSLNAMTNSQYYVANTTNNIEYDGYTVKLTADIDVQTCEIYHIKIAIGDAGDGVYDSGVLISVNSPPCPINKVNWAGIDTIASEGCSNFKVDLNRTGETNSAISVNFKTYGSATAANDYEFTSTKYDFPANVTSATFDIPVLADASTEGSESVFLVATYSNCSYDYSDTIELVIDESTITTNEIIIDETCDGLCNGQISLNILGGQNYTYAWDNGGTGTIISNLCPGDYSVQITNGVNCYAKKFTVDAGEVIKDPAVSAMGPYCDSWANQSFTPLETGGTFSGLGVTGNPQVFSPAIAGTGTHTITHSIGKNCPQTTTFTIEVLAQQTAAIDAVNPICINEDTLQLIASRGSGTWTGTGISDPINGIFNPNAAGAGTHTVYYEISGQCGDTAEIDVDVVAPIDPTIQSIPIVCVGNKDVQLMAANTGGIWQGSIISNSGIIAAGTPEGTYTVYYEINDVCSSIDSLTFPILKTPQTNFSIDAGGCVPLQLVAKDISDSNAVNSAWYVDSVFQSNTLDSATLAFDSARCYNIILINTYANGCIDTLNMDSAFCGSAPPIADFVFFPRGIDLSDQTVKFYDQSTDAEKLYWNFGSLASPDTSTELNPTTRFLYKEPDTALVTLTAINGLGCKDSVTYPIVVKDVSTLYIPNCFTPNGDDKNDIFFPETNGVDILAFEFYIFNRWGELIYSTTELHAGWDGTVNGGQANRIAPVGVYVWRINYLDPTKAKKQHLMGTVTLVR